jgi:hypothetical protein
MTAVAHRGPLAPTAVGREATTVVLRGPRHRRASGPVAPRPVAPARPVSPQPPSWAPTGFGYPPPSAYPAIPVPPGAALVPAGLNAPLSGIFPVEVPPSSGFPLLDRAVARGRWALACEPETGRRAAHGR